jgi:site-specific DNA recombinase
MRDRLTTGEIPFRKAYLGSVIDRVEVDDHRIRIFGRKDVLEQALVAGAGSGSSGVRTSVRSWRTRRDSNPWPLPSEGSALSS